MSDDPLIKRLTQLKPDGSGLDRDALLFAAGRASVRPNRGWMALAGALAASHLVTLTLFLWHRDPVPVPMPDKETPPVAHVEPPVQPIPEGTAAWMRRERLIEAEGNLPLPGAVEQVTPSDGALRAFGSLPADLLQ